MSRGSTGISEAFKKGDMPKISVVSEHTGARPRLTFFRDKLVHVAVVVHTIHRLDQTTPA